MVKDVKKLFICMTMMAVLMIGANFSSGDKVLAQEGQKESQQVFVNLPTDAKKNDYIYDTDGKLIAAFLSDGTYMSYIYDSNGNQKNKKKVNQSIQPTVNLSAHSYEIYIRGIRSNAEQIYFPTWTEHNGQDDTEWIKGTKVSDGVWKATVFFKNHGMETGSYITHIYDGDRMVASTIVNVGINVKVRSPEKASLKDESYDIYIDGVGESVSEVRFPTWTEANGQDDLEQPWIKGVNQGNGTWKITIPFKKHNYETGKYITHIYSFDKYGNNMMLSAAEVNVTGGVQYPNETDLSSVSYDIIIYGLDHNAQKVQFPTWTAHNGQDDIEWIKGTKVSDGVWKATVIFKNHGMETGSYITHIYDGERMVAATTVNVGFNVKVRSPEKASLKDESYDIYIDGVGASVKEVRFPTWTEANGRDDLEQPWIRGVNQGNGTWKITIPFKKHNYDTGKYITHIYSFDKYGNNMMLSAAEVNVTGGVQYPNETDLSSVSYDITIYGLDHNAQKVQFPTWTAHNDQDDLKWIEGSKVANGVWKATVVYSKHNQEAGSYITHVYADGKFVDGFIVTVRGNNVQVKAPQEVKRSDGAYEVFVEGVPTSINEVRFPTWTDHNGQDDLESPWIKGEKVKPGVWKIRIPLSKHNNESGTYITHVYTVDQYGNMMAVAWVHVQVMD